MRENDEWSGLADFLAGMIEKYACEMDLDSLPDPDRHYRAKSIFEQYTIFMELRSQMRNRVIEVPT